MIKIILNILLVSGFVFAQSQYDPSSDLRQTFCPNQGDFTRVSINHTQALRSIVERLQVDENCASVASGTSRLIQSLTNLDSLKTDNTELGEAEISLDLFEQEFASYQASFIDRYVRNNSPVVNGVSTLPSNSDIQNALANFLSSDSTAITYTNRISDLRIDIIDLQLSYGFSKSDKRVEDRKNKLIAIQSNLSSVLGQLSSSSHCINNNQYLKTNALSLVTGLASTFMNDFAGTAISLGSNFVSSVSDLIRTIKSNHKLIKLRDADFMDSIGCSYLGMARTYCSARNANSLVQNISFIKSGTQKGCKNCKTLLLGLKLKNKTLRVLNQWITSLFAASPPINLNAASPKTEAEDLRANFAKLKITLSAIFSDARTDLSFATSAQQRTNILASLFNSIYFRILANNGGSSNSTSSFSTLPYLNSFALDRSCGPYVYLYSRGTQRTIVRDSNLNCLADVQNNFGGEREFSVDELEETMERLNLEAQEFVANEVAKSSKVNSQEILKEFDDLSFGTSPRKVLLELIQYNNDLLKYLETYTGDKKNLILLINRMNRSYSEALAKEAQLECTVQQPNPDNSNSSSDNPFIRSSINCEANRLAEEKVSGLSLIFAPGREELYVQDAFNSILKTHVDIAVERGDITNEELIFLMNDETNNQADVLSRYALTRSAVAADTEWAMSKTKVNIEVFSSMFEKPLYRIIKKLKSKKSNEDRQTLGRLCIASLVSKSNSRTFRKIKSLCRGTYIRSLFPKELNDLRYNDSFGKKYEDKICTMFDHNQRIQFFEDRI